MTRLLLAAALGVAALAGCGTGPVPSQGDPDRGAGDQRRCIGNLVGT